MTEIMGVGLFFSNTVGQLKLDKPAAQKSELEIEVDKYISLLNSEKEDVQQEAVRQLSRYLNGAVNFTLKEKIGPELASYLVKRGGGGKGGSCSQAAPLLQTALGRYLEVTASSDSRGEIVKILLEGSKLWDSGQARKGQADTSDCRLAVLVILYEFLWKVDILNETKIGITEVLLERLSRDGSTAIRADATEKLGMLVEADFLPQELKDRINQALAPREDKTIRKSK